MLTKFSFYSLYTYFSSRILKIKLCKTLSIVIYRFSCVIHLPPTFRTSLSILITYGKAVSFLWYLHQGTIQYRILTHKKFEFHV
jgi:hypothetical protein